jgi:hypothetical protein
MDGSLHVLFPSVVDGGRYRVWVLDYRRWMALAFLGGSTED